MKDIVNKLNSLSFETNQIVNKAEANALTLNQQVTGSTPVRLITDSLVISWVAYPSFPGLEQHNLARIAPKFRGWESR